jgi:hypothetical protein
MATIFQFPHRKNADKTFDSICNKCFKTIGTATSEEALVEMELNHVCDPNALQIVDQTKHNA